MERHLIAASKCIREAFPSTSSQALRTSDKRVCLFHLQRQMHYIVRSVHYCSFPDHHHYHHIVLTMVPFAFRIQIAAQFCPKPV